MKPRHPTPHELKLWRESNRFTQKKNPDALLAVETEEDEFAREVAPTTTKKTVAVAKAKTKTPPPSLDALTTREASKLRKNYPEIDATLDLHGLTKLEAYAKVKSFVARAHKSGKRHLLIITGKGRTGEGILRTELPHWLNEPGLRPLISAFTHGKPEKGGNGVTHVLVKKYRE